MAKNTSGLFKTQNNAQILPKQLKQLWKSPENDLFDPKNGQKRPLQTAKVSKVLTENLDFVGHYIYINIPSWNYTHKEAPKA